MKKRLFAALVCAMMVIALLPAAALADGEKTTLDIREGSITIGNGTVSGCATGGSAVTVPDPDGYKIIGGGTTTTNTITVTGGTHKIILDGVSIDVSGVNGCAFDIQPGSNSDTVVNLDLDGTNVLRSGGARAGLQVPSHATVTITGSGSLTATGGNDGAGIGGNVAFEASGTVIISGGTVNATGGGNSAGIGSDRYGDGVTVTISGGTVNATSTSGGAGIGGGYAGNGGTVNISGGTVNATGTSGGAGIGGGHGAAGGTVRISGGNVKATGSDGGADIGAGDMGNGGTLKDADGTNNVYRIALTLDGDTPIAGLTAADISSAYGMKDVKPLDGNKLYLYLPEGTVVNSVTTGDTPPRLFTNQTGADILVAGDHSSTGTLTEVATATISNVTFSGMTGTEITPASVTVTLTGEKFVTMNKDADVSDWFTNLPAGLTAKLSSAISSGATSAQVTISGTPTKASTEAIAVTIPGSRLSVEKAPLTATVNDNARWAIALAAPVITAPTADRIVPVIVGNSPTFSVTATNANAYQWQIDRGSGFVQLAGAMASSCTVEPATLAHDGYRYRCIVSNGSTTATSHVFTLQVTPPPTVTEVWVNPATVNVAKGGTQPFNATVIGANSPSQTVTWSVAGGKSGTSIDEDGNLTVAADETAAMLTVKATSTVNTDKFGTATVTVVSAPEYEITQGQNGEAVKNSTDGLGFTANGELDAFTDVFVDGEKLSDQHYTTRSGSTIVTLKASYLATLSVGRHTLRVSFTDGYAETNFTILAEIAEAPVPETGDDGQPILWFGIALMACAGFAANMLVRRRRLNG